MFGRAFGFVQGALTLFASALLIGGVGPWLPFQMIAAAWIGYLAGCLPPWRGRRELLMLAAYGAVAGLLYGLIMDMWFWPFTTSGTNQLHYVPGDALRRQPAALLGVSPRERARLRHSARSATPHSSSSPARRARRTPSGRP